MLRSLILISVLAMASVSHAYLLVNPSVVYFGNVPVGRQQFGNAMIQNMSNKSANIAISTFGCQDYEVFGTCATLQPYGSCGVTMIFRPTSVGNKDCQIIIHSFGGAGDQATIMTIGTGVETQSTP